MIDADDLLSLVRNYNPKTNEALIRGAYDYARGCMTGRNAIRASPISRIPSPSPPS
jgi:guanosine-3',5'-bis(diphosphate) 3'-pyrophosphohydrolase